MPRALRNEYSRTACHTIAGLGWMSADADHRRGEYFQELVSVVNSSTSVWQRVAVTNTGGSWSTGNVFVAKTAEAFTYDADGNLTSDGRWTYAWDAENRLINMTSGSSTPTGSKFKMDFAYDWKGRRIEKQVSTNNGSGYFAQYTNRFVYDGWNLLAVLAPNSQLQSCFIWGLDLSGSMQGAGGVGGLLAVKDATNGVHFCAYDGNGNVAALLNADGSGLTAQYEYGPFGEVLRSTGTMARTNQFRFSTKYQDDESDQLYYGFRSYNPSTGRWLSRDPIANRGSAALYLPMRNNLINRIDIFGLKDFHFGFGVTLEPWNSEADQPMRGEVVVSDISYTEVAIKFRVVRPVTEENQELWSTYTQPWRKNVTTDGWLWPNLAALLTAKGETDVTRYGGYDPNKQVDDDFSGIVVRRQGSSGRPLISADWVNENGVTDIKDISHSARIRENFRVHVGGPPCETRSPISIWMTYADLYNWSGNFENHGWPKEFNGGTLVYIKIDWQMEADATFSPVFTTSGTSPPPSTGLGSYWRAWKNMGAPSRYSDTVTDDPQN